MYVMLSEELLFMHVLGLGGAKKTLVAELSILMPLERLTVFKTASGTTPLGQPERSEAVFKKRE